MVNCASAHSVLVTGKLTYTFQTNCLCLLYRVLLISSRIFYALRLFCRISSWENKDLYAQAVRALRLRELQNVERMSAVRAGLGSIIPLQLLTMFSPLEMELRTCGLPYINLEFLKVILFINNYTFFLATFTNYYSIPSPLTSESPFWLEIFLQIRGEVRKSCLLVHTHTWTWQLFFF